MDFNPPKNVRVITADELEKMEEPVFNGPVLIKGDVTNRGIYNKHIIVEGGGLWIDGGIKHYNIIVSPVIQEPRAEREVIDKEWGNAAKQGVGLYVKGSIEGYETITAPNIVIGGNLAGQPALDLASVAKAHGGFLHVDGDVIGNRKVLSSVIRDHSGADPALSFEEYFYEASDNLNATGPIRIGGTVSDVSLDSGNGTVTPGKVQKSWVIVGDKSGFKVIHSPEQKQTKGPSATRG